ncbi:hypothetical protein [Streptomyces sp. SDr-06]|nr:hypothetical protein [Streptomyces sp. SDr-06]
MNDPFSECRKHAVQMREFYDAYIFAGFSPAEAFAMTLVVVKGLCQR